MRLAVELMRVQAPDIGKGFIEEPEAPVRGEHGYPFAQCLDGLPLDLDQRVVPAL